MTPNTHRATAPQHHQTRKGNLAILTIVLAALLGWAIPTAAYSASASDGSIPTVRTPEEMTAAVPADTEAVTDEVVDPASVSTQKLEDLGLSTQEAAEATQTAADDASEGAQAIADAVDQNATTEATVLEDDTVRVDYPFALKRIAVLSTTGDVDTTGSTSAVYDELTGYYILTYETEEDAAAVYDRLIALYGAENVFVDTEAHVSASDSYSGWGVGADYMNLAQAKADIKTSATATVAVLDTGCRATHQAFQGVTFSPASCSIIGSTSSKGATPSSSFEDNNQHGTHVSSIIASGTPSNVRLLEIDVTNSWGAASFWDLYYALVYAHKNGASIYNLSIGHDFSSKANGTLSQSDKTVVDTFDKELKAITDAGGLVVVAAGNYEAKDATGKFGYASMEQYYSYPAISNYVISVGGLTHTEAWDTPANAPVPDGTYSFYGSSLDLSAPGTQILGAYFGNDTSTLYMDGTSMAAPHVTALAADLKLLNPNATGADIAYAMEHTYCKDVTAGAASAGWDKYSGYGMPRYVSGAKVGTKPAGASLGHNASNGSSSSGGNSGSSGSGSAGFGSSGNKGGSASSNSGSKSGNSGASSTNNTMSLYRVYNPATGEHLYTTHREEVDHLVASGWRWETDQTMQVPRSSATPVWRLVNTADDDHHYTTDAWEAKVLTTQRGWRYDFGGEPAFYGAAKDQAPVYRIYDTRAARFGHLFTKDAYEKSVWLKAGGWNDEGVGWYAVR